MMGLSNCLLRKTAVVEQNRIFLLWLKHMTGKDHIRMDTIFFHIFEPGQIISLAMYVHVCTLCTTFGPAQNIHGDILSS